ncbi:MAG: hypothetical protein ABH872_04910 [Candidatus Omnitrophota bacterium]
MNTEMLDLQGLFLGSRKMIDRPEMSMQFNFPLHELLNHIFICGSRDAGKTVLAKAIIEELAFKDIPSIVIDTKGYLSSLGLLLDKASLERRDVLLNDELDGITATDFEAHLKNLQAFGFGEQDIRRLRDTTHIAVFTPGSDTGMPLALSSLTNPPEQIKELYKNDPEKVSARAYAYASLLIDRIFQGNNANERAAEKRLISELILYAWLSKAELEGLIGLVQLLKLLNDPPIEEIDGKTIEEFIPYERCEELSKRLRDFLIGTEQVWYSGTPLDIDLLCGRYQRTGKNHISVINISGLNDFASRCFVIMRLADTIYEWMTRKGKSGRIRLFFYIDEIGGKNAFYPSGKPEPVSKSAIDTLLNESGDFGVACMFGSGFLKTVDHKGLGKCKTWAIGHFPEEKDHETVFEGLSQADLLFDKAKAMITLPVKGEFLLRLSYGGFVLLKERWLCGIHREIQPQFLKRVIKQEVRDNFKAFYVLEQIPEEQLVVERPRKERPVVLIPETIFENFNFGSERIDEFVLPIEPEEAIKLCLRELSRVDISAEEVEFKLVQLYVGCVHRADWKMDTLIRDQRGQAVDRIVDEGMYARCDTQLSITPEVKDKMAQMAAERFHQRCKEICQRISVLIAQSRPMTKMEVLGGISKDTRLRSKNVAIFLKQRNVAYAYKFTLEYRKKIINCIVDALNKEARVDYPEFSKSEAISELKGLFPDFEIEAQNLISAEDLYNFQHDTDDYSYNFRVSKKSCKALKRKISITEKKAREIAVIKIKDDPYAVWRYGGTWNLFYPQGIRLCIDEDNRNVITKHVMSEGKTKEIAFNFVNNMIGKENFTIENIDFKTGRWYLAISSEKWRADLMVDENSKVSETISLQEQYCQKQAYETLKKYNISLTVECVGRRWKDGWEFKFSTHLGYIIVRITSTTKEILKESLNREGIIHFAKLEVDGDVVRVIDKTAFWEVMLKKDNGLYRVHIGKHDGSVTGVAQKQHFFWKKIK